MEIPSEQETLAMRSEVQEKMHSSESAPAAPATGPSLLLQLGKLIIRARSTSPASVRPSANSAPRPSKLLPSTSQQVVVQPQLKSDEDEDAALGEELASHVIALCHHMEPVCIEVSLSAQCRECAAPLYERQRRALLLERWTMRTIAYKSKEGPAMINSQWLLNAVRSQLHFSQLSAWLARLQTRPQPRRKLSREQCNYKKIEVNCGEEIDPRKLNIVYSIKTPSGKQTEFAKPPTDHTFPVTDIGNNTYLIVNLESLPRLEDIPALKCLCQTQKRRTSKDNTAEELVGKLNDLSIGSRKYDGAINSNIGTPNRRLSIISNPGSTEYLYTVDNEKEVVDDRMLTPCSENGKHKCNCDDESDGNKDTNNTKHPPKKLDERRLKEIAKYKRRIRKEKMKKHCDSTSSEGDGLKSKETTSIPILQASRFDRFRAIGCYRNQTYLTLPASRIETKSPFVEADSISPPEFKKTNSVGTQTDEFLCQCGNTLDLKCESCHRGMVRSEANYNLASLTDTEDKQGIGARRKLNDIEDEKSLKKHKCDNSIICDNVNININDGLIKRPKLRRVFPIVDRLERIVNDRQRKDTEKDIQDLHLNTDDSVFSVPKDSKRQKTFSISDDDYVLYERCDYGTFDRHDTDSPKDEISPDFKFAAPQQDFQSESKHSLESLKDGFIFPDPKKGHDNVPSPSEMDKFRWRFDSAASMVFHTRTGLPLTSSPAPLRRGNNCFDFDDSINGISGIKSALFHPISPVSPVPPASPASPPPAPRTPPPRRDRHKLRMGPTTGLLGSFEESALQGRLEAVATVHGFTAELGASGAFCPPHKRLPVTVFFYAPGGTNAPYMGHINLGPEGYHVARSGTIQVSLFNPHGTLVKMFVVLYELGSMPAGARTFLRQRTLYMPAGADPPATTHHKWLRYLIHLRFMTSKSGNLFLHTDIRLIVSRKADLDTATAHSALFRPIPTKHDQKPDQTDKPTNRAPNRVFGGSSEFDSERHAMRELCYENQNGVSYELRSFTYAPENPKYSPR